MTGQPSRARIRIQPSSGRAAVDWRELIDYRDLLFFLVKRDFSAIYKQSILGPAWYIIQPLATTIVFTVIFGRLAKVSTDETPPFLFYMSGMIFWNYFSTCMTNIAESLMTNAGVFRKVYFPRLVVPLSLVTSNLAQFLLNLSTYSCFYVYFLSQGVQGVEPSAWILALPLLVVQTAVAGLGVGLWMASLTVKYRDLRFALPFISQLWLYVTPVVYPASLVPEKWRPLLALNPMAGVVEFNRFAFLGAGHVDGVFLGLSLASGLLLFVTGLLAFQRVERTFVDTI